MDISINLSRVNFQYLNVVENLQFPIDSNTLKGQVIYHMEERKNG